MPTIVAGLRIATVTTVGLVTVAALIGRGGLGQLIYRGLQNFSSPVGVAQIVAGTVLSIVLAVLADLILVVGQRLLTPWTRRRPA
jgi:osmoprotectant transport system permease protein